MDQRQKTNDQKLLVICGPTATGKTELAVKLAKEFNGELISADSRQVYKGMDIGTGKDREKLEDIPLRLLDIADPDQNFSVAQYQDLAWKAIEDIWKRNKLPILVGGTGLYIKAVVDGIETKGIPQDWDLRKKLESLPLKDLQKKLEEIDSKKWHSMNSSDQSNPRRLIRAIEIAMYRKSKNHYDTMTYHSSLDVLIIGLTAPNKILYQRIDERVEKRVKQGIIDEIQSLLDKGYSWDLPSMSGLGYRVWKDFFDKKATKEETIQKWKFDEHSYARRQLTWFKKDKRINWFDITSFSYKENINKQIKTWFSK